MALFLDLTPQIEARLLAEAATHGITVSELITRIVAECAPREPEAGAKQETSQPTDANGATNTEESLDAILEDMVIGRKEDERAFRELAVQVVTQKNNLQADLDRENRLIEEYARKADLALQSGNRELAKQFLKEKALHARRLPELERDLQAATEHAQRVKTALANGEELIRQRVGHILAMRTAFQQIMIQLKICHRLDQFRLTDDDSYFQWLRERVQTLQNRAAALATEVMTLAETKFWQTAQFVPESASTSESESYEEAQQLPENLDIDAQLDLIERILEIQDDEPDIDSELDRLEHKLETEADKPQTEGDE